MNVLIKVFSLSRYITLHGYLDSNVSSFTVIRIEPKSLQKDSAVDEFPSQFKECGLCSLTFGHESVNICTRKKYV